VNAEWFEKENLDAEVRRRIRTVETVLDIGPGISPQSIFKPKVHICIEPFAPYLERLRKELASESGFVFLNTEWKTGVELMPQKSVDTVFALDLIEHLSKSDGLDLLRHAERLARQQVVIFTPLGFYAQDYDDPAKPDRWGMQGGHWQTHRSGWAPEDFPAPWQVFACKHYHSMDQHEQPLSEPHGAFWAIRDFGAPSPRPLTVRIGAKVKMLIRRWTR